MSSTLFPAKDLPIPDIATGYSQDETGVWRNNVFVTPIQGCPAGGIASTADDLFRFDRALRKGTLLGPGWTEWVFSNQVPNPEDVQTEAQLADRAWGVAGGAQGVNALLESDGETATVVLANMDPPIAMALGKVLRESIEE
jgi:CubicO group peptidase (beta-lactamase class C family)